MAFVKAWTKCKFPNGKTGLKTTQILHKNKACDKQHQLPREEMSCHEPLKHGPWSCEYPDCNYKTFHAGHLSRHLRFKGHEQKPAAKSDDPSGPKDINDNKDSSSDSAAKNEN